MPITSFARTAYSAAAWLAQPLLRLKLRRRGRAEPLYLEAVNERFGHYDAPRGRRPKPPPQGQPERRARQRPVDGAGQYIWIHAVSLGETRAAGILIAALRKREPRVRVLLTHGTATGRAEGAKLVRPGDLQAWQPWDTPGAVRRFLTRFKPRVGVLIETEVWPNLVAECERASVPLALVNARMSEQSLARAERMAWLARPAYVGLSVVYAQTEADAKRLRRLGAPVAGVYGNFKFDARLDAPQRAQRRLGHAWRAQSDRPILMLASAREGEEQLLIDALRLKLPGETAAPGALTAFRSSDLHAPPESAPVRWLVVPRHPQRFDEVAAQFEAAGFSVSRRSAWGDGMPEDTDVWIGDTMGEMALYYSAADVALLGGSFAHFGGQNLIEAALCGCPVVLGPSTFNFAEAAEQAIVAGAALRTPGMARAVVQARGVAFDGMKRGAMADAAQQFAVAHRGATEKTARAVARLVRSPDR